MKFRKRTAAWVSAGVIMLSISGAWAYFAQKRTVTLSVTPETMGIQLDTSAFKLSTEPMVPGDMNPLQLKVTNTGQRDVKVVAEVTVASQEPMDSDSVEWFIATEKMKNDFGTGEVIYHLPKTTGTATLDNSTDTVQFLNKQTNKDGAITAVTFLVQGGKLSGQKAADYATKKSTTMKFWLALASKTGNDFQGNKCTVTADVYTVQADHTDNVVWANLKESADLVNSVTSGT